MLTFSCPDCRKTVNAPETEVGNLIDCPHCNQRIRVPQGGSSNTLVYLVVAGGVLLVGCPMLIVVCLAAISVLGQKASGTFTTVSYTINSPPNKAPARP
jgi:DNA-directed RNA polymerase subunit RPC12/RpoP